MAAKTKTKTSNNVKTNFGKRKEGKAQKRKGPKDKIEKIYVSQGR
jgi:hypothetical protein